jgi:hypothetical protein
LRRETCRIYFAIFDGVDEERGCKDLPFTIPINDGTELIPQ